MKCNSKSCILIDNSRIDVLRALTGIELINICISCTCNNAGNQAGRIDTKSLVKHIRVAKRRNLNLC